MNVTILDESPDLSRTVLRRCWVAAKTCTSKRTPSELWQRSAKVSEERMLRLVEDEVIQSGHLSVLRHAVLTYSIDGISRACAQQLTRHNAGFSYEMQSQRAVVVGFPVTDFITPPSIARDPERLRAFDAANASALGSYGHLLGLDADPEDARAVLPNATPTNLVATINMNALLNFCAERMCILAQDEIRTLASKLRVATITAVPWMKPHLLIKCQRAGLCFESRNKGNIRCGIKPHQDSVVLVPKAEYATLKARTAVEE